MVLLYHLLYVVEKKQTSEKTVAKGGASQSNVKTMKMNVVVYMLYKTIHGWRCPTLPPTPPLPSPLLHDLESLMSVIFWDGIKDKTVDCNLHSSDS